MRPKKPATEKLRPLTVYLLPKVYKELETWAQQDKRSISSMATFMIEHSLSCVTFKAGHVPIDQIKYLKGQGK